MDRLAPTAVIAMLGIRIYPQTALQEIAVQEGVIAREDDLSLPRFYISPLIGPERLIEFVTEAAMGRRGWIVPGSGDQHLVAADGGDTQVRRAWALVGAGR